MPTISIIVPVYNVEKYIRRCLDSILAQTFTAWECILVDDGSPDDSGTICDEYAEKDNRFRVIHKENGGQASARNTALDIVNGEYIAFVDSDDYVHPQYLERMYKNAKAYNADVSFCCGISFDDEVPNTIFDKSLPTVYSGKEFYRLIFLTDKEYKPWVLWDKLWKKSCFSNFRLPEGRIYEDNASVYKLIYQSLIVVDCEAVLYYYQKNPTSTMHQKFSYKNLDWLLVLKEMIIFFKKKGEQEILKKLVIQYIHTLCNFYENVISILQNQKAAKRIKHDLQKSILLYWKNYEIHFSKYPHIYATAFPFFSNCYWNFMGIISKFKQ